MTGEAQRSRSIPSLDGLRGIAVLMVIGAHLGYMEMAVAQFKKHHLALAAKLFQIDAGDLGVSVFFVISGYLITTLLLRHQDEQGRVSLKNFYARRFFRIFPPYYFYLLVIAVLWGLHLVPMLRGALLSSLFYVSNYYPYALSHPAGDGWLVGHTWSLSLEEQFYLAWPAYLHWLGPKRSAWVGCVLLMLSPFLRAATLHFVPGSALFGQVDRMFHTRVDTIMAGCVLALVGVWPAVRERLVKVAQNKTAGAVALVLLYVVLHRDWQSFRAMQWFGLGTEAILIAFLILFCIENAQTLPGRLLNNRWLRHIGMISYSLYLWQQLWTGPVQVAGEMHFYVRLLVIFACAEFSYFVVERPSFRVRDWYLQRKSQRLQASA